MKLPGRRWSLAFSEPYSAITADTRQGFQGITLLLGLSLLVGIVAISVTLQHRVRRRRAEERARLAERQAALERQARQSEQLVALGKMTSQIAHQVNTPLAALGLNVAYLREELSRRSGGGANPEMEEVSDAILAEIDRLKHVVNDYLRFSRLPQPVPVTEALRTLLESFLDFIQPEARERGVRVEADLGTDPATVRIDADFFRDALLNLVRNGFEAMPEGGVLRVGLRRTEKELVLTLADSGRGVPPDILPRIFDPFFTTKKGGTGLGLAHTRRVMEEQGGTIECVSAPGEGTTFIIRLPAVPAPEAEEILLGQKER
ncbi:MAG: PAS domain-containing sensor histidine kinase [Terriglobia bacterium]